MCDGAANVVSQTVARGLCVGCGACAGVCPRENLSVGWNAHGAYEPTDRGMCADGCRLCLDVCPFNDGEENEDSLARRLFGDQGDIRHTSETGFYLASWVGHVECGDYRAAGASGGAATWFLAKLLRTGVVDRVVCVTPDTDPDRLFRFACFDDPDDLCRSSKSAYYPVEMSAVVKEILANDARYACIGLPCFVKALRLAAEKMPRLRERIVVCAGLVCGRLKSRWFAEHLARRIGLSPGELKSASFREKDSALPASELVFEASDGAATGRLLWSEGYKDVWTTGQFNIPACSFCDDVFAELADVSFMDAWLPEFKSDSRGTSIVLARSRLAGQVIADGIESRELAMRPAAVGEVIGSQGDVVYDKRRVLPWRLWLADHDGRPRPRKRAAAAKPDALNLRLLRAAEAVRAASYEAMAAQRASSPKGLAAYDSLIRVPLRRLHGLLRLRRLVVQTTAVPRKVIRLVSGRGR